MNSIVNGQTVEADTNNFSAKSLDEIIIYPNPIADHLQINTVCTFVILNITGKEVLAGEITDTRQIVDVSNMKTGVYFIKIKNNFGTVTKKLKKL